MDAITHLNAALDGRYVIDREIGAGGMAVVYQALDVRHERRVALKVLRHDIGGSVAAERFLREIRIAGQLHHPHIVPVFDSGQAGDDLYFVMPLVEGESLRALLARRGPLPVTDARRLTRELGEALTYAHERGIVHRDIKPENVLMASEHASLADFGIAHAAAAAAGDRLTATGVSLGTPAYMSPEQAAGKADPDTRGDQYSLACIVYEMLTGRPPFTGTNALSVLHQHATGTPAKVREIRPDTPVAMASAIMRALAKSPDDRFETIAQFVDALAAENESRSESSGGWPASLRGRRAGLTGGAVIVALGAAVWWGWFSLRSHRADAVSVDRKYVVVVLPFLDVSTDTSHAYLASGLTEEVNAQLSQLSALRVVSRTAMARYLQAPDRLQRLAKEQGVGSIVEGSIRVEGQRARFDVRLIDARSGQAVWSDTLTRDLTNVLGVERTVARGVSEALNASLTPAEARRAGRPLTVDPVAYDLYMRARSMTGPDAAAKGVVLLHRAILLDSTFARAWAYLAGRYYVLSLQGSRAYQDSGFASARRAVALDPELPQGYNALGTMYGALERNAPSRAAFLTSVQLDPNAARVMANLSATEGGMGRYDEEVHWAGRAIALDPGDDVLPFFLAIGLLRLEDDETTDRFLIQATGRFPDNSRLAYVTAVLEAQRGRDSVAMEKLRAILVRTPSREVRAQLAALAVLTKAPDAESLAARFVATTPTERSFVMPESFRALLGLVYARSGRRALADSMWTEALAADRRDLADSVDAPEVPAEIAAIAAIRGDTSTALDWLARAHRAGFNRPTILARDPFFDRLRGIARFQSLVAQMKVDLAAMRRRAAVGAASATATALMARPKR